MSVPKNTNKFSTNFQNYQIQGQSTEGKEKSKKIETMTRRLSKSEFFCINCIQFKNKK